MELKAAINSRQSFLVSVELGEEGITFTQLAESFAGCSLCRAQTPTSACRKQDQTTAPQPACMHLPTDETWEELLPDLTSQRTVSYSEDSLGVGTGLPRVTGLNRFLGIQWYLEARQLSSHGDGARPGCFEAYSFKTLPTRQWSILWQEQETKQHRICAQTRQACSYLIERQVYAACFQEMA